MRSDLGGFRASMSHNALTMTRASTALRRTATPFTALLALSIATACSCSQPSDEELEGETRILERRGTAYTSAQRAEDAASGAGDVLDPNAGDEGDAALAGGAGTPDEVAARAPLGADAIDPNLASRLKADPSAEAGDEIEGLVTFRRLSLVGSDVTALIDYLFNPETEAAKAFDFPKEVKELAGPDKAVIGYMIALEYKPKTTDLVKFMLVRDLMQCCFGGMPRPDEWIYVEMEGDRTTEIYHYVPIVVRGTLKVGRIDDEYGLMSGVYSMKAKSVELFQPK